MVGLASLTSSRAARPTRHFVIPYLAVCPFIKSRVNEGRLHLVAIRWNTVETPQDSVTAQTAFPKTRYDEYLKNYSEYH